MWKYIFDSVAGTSHAVSGSDCQDTSSVSPLLLSNGDSAVVFVCADGAGSASESKVGSALACKTVQDLVIKFFDEGGAPEAINEELLRGWIRGAHEALVTEAQAREIIARELACTLLVAVVCQSVMACMQIGDGAIVKCVDGNYETIFWPQNGEYQNTTFFLTDPQYAGNVQVHIDPTSITQIAMFTDGLQMLALNFASRTAHGPFFSPLFTALRDQPAEDLFVPLRQFLGSDAVNARTDDDKTLILALKVSEDVADAL